MFGYSRSPGGQGTVGYGSAADPVPEAESEKWRGADVRWTAVLRRLRLGLGLLHLAPQDHARRRRVQMLAVYAVRQRRVYITLYYPGSDLGGSSGGYLQAGPVR